VIDTSRLSRPKADKHSTGGVGDKVSLVLAPLLACSGVAVPMISGRGLGLTGGTLDKLESIPGYRTHVGPAEFLDIVEACGCSIIGQTETLAPADRKLYALRDVTGTVPSVPLIVASILSKKLAEGIDGLVLDVKCGGGAFMKTREEARTLARALIWVAREMGLKSAALITAMDQPLGRTAGNALEVSEAINALRGQGPGDLMEITLALAAKTLTLVGAAPTDAEAAALLQRKIRSGEAAAAFQEMIRRHGGDPRAVEDPGRLPSSRYRENVTAPRGGLVSEASAEQVGRACLVLGAGRTRITDRIDPAAGVSDIRKTGERVAAGDRLAVVHGSRREAVAEAKAMVGKAFVLTDETVMPGPLILEAVT
jgi:pyrimidine-nucleoside phosphorylase